MSIKETSALMPNIRERISDDEYRTYYFGSKAKYIEAEGQDGSVTNVQQEIDNLYDAIEDGGGGSDIDIDFSSLKTKVTKSDTNGDISVDNKDIEVYNDQELQGKVATDQNYIYKMSGDSIDIQYFADEKDILGGYPAPSTGDYGSFTPNPMSLSDKTPCRIYINPSPSNSNVWKGGEGRNKVKFNVRSAYDAGSWMLLPDLKNGTIAMDPNYDDPTVAFNIVIASGVNLDSNTKYILNGIADTATGLTFEVSGDGLPAKQGTEITFNGTTNITIKLIGEDNFDLGLVVSPMVRLASDYDSTWQAYERFEVPSAQGKDFVLKQTNTSLDESSVPVKEVNHYFAIPYVIGVNNEMEETPTGDYAYGYYMQKITNGTDTYTMEYYPDDYIYLLDDGGSNTVKFLTTDGYDRFVHLEETSWNTGVWRYKLNDEEWEEGYPPIFNEAGFLSKYDTLDYEESTYYVDESTISYFDTTEEFNKFCQLGLLYFGVIDLGLYTFYGSNELYIGYLQRGVETPFEYISDRDVCDMDPEKWHEPSNGALVIKKTDNGPSVVFDTQKINMDFYEKTNVNLQLYSYNTTNGILTKMSNENDVFMFTCRPGNSVSRVTYSSDTSLTEVTGYANESELAQLSPNDSVGTYIMSGHYPKKEVAPKKLCVEFDGQDGYPSATPIAWNSKSPLANIISFNNWTTSQYSSSQVDISRSVANDYENFTIYWSSSYRDKMIDLILCSNLDSVLSSDEGVSIGFRFLTNSKANYIPDLVNAYGYLSKTGRYNDSNNIKIKLNDLSAIKTIIYNSAYKYLGIYIKNASAVGFSYSGTISITPIIRKPESYTYSTDEWGGTATGYYPIANFSDTYGYIPEKSKSITSLIAADAARITLDKRQILHQDRTKIGYANFSNVNFYDIVCPYDNKHYKFFYYITRAQETGEDTYNNNYYGTLEIWSNVPIIFNLGGYAHYYYPDENKFIAFEYSGLTGDPITFEEDNFYMKYTGPNDEEYALYNMLISDDKFYQGQTNIPFFDTDYDGGISIESKSRYLYTSTNGSTYVSTLNTLVTNNQTYGLKIDLKNKKIYRTYDYVPVFELDSAPSYSYVSASRLVWDGFKSTKADSRFEDYPAQGEPALIRTDRYLRNGVEVDTPCCWDIELVNVDANELILPTSDQDPVHYVSIFVELRAGEVGDYTYSGNGTLSLQYVASGLAFVEDVQDLQAEIDKANSRIDTVMAMIVSSLNGSY